MKKLVISPHNDDFALFCAFVCQREHPLILTLYDSYTQPERGFAACSKEARRYEDTAAADILGCQIEFAGIPDNLSPAAMYSHTTSYFMSTRTRPSLLADIEVIWLPLREEKGHPHHNIVNQTCFDIFRAYSGARIRYYMTYTSDGKSSRPDCLYLPTSGDQIAKKLRAMSCYTSQLDMTPGLGCWPHFMRDLSEYVVV